MNDAPSYAVSSTWPTPNPELTASMMGTILSGQGFGETPPPQPWTAAERAAEMDRCAGWLSDALKGASLTFEEARAGVIAGHFQLWSGPSLAGAMLSELIASPRMRALHVFAAGGSLQAIRQITPAIERFAVLCGCNYGGATGRKGWTRALRPLGYAPSPLTTVEKAL